MAFASLTESVLLRFVVDTTAITTIPITHTSVVLIVTETICKKFVFDACFLRRARGFGCCGRRGRRGRGCWSFKWTFAILLAVQTLTAGLGVAVLVLILLSRATATVTLVPVASSIVIVIIAKAVADKRRSATRSLDFFATTDVVFLVFRAI